MAVGFGENEPVVRGRFYAKGEGKLVVADAARGGRDKGGAQTGIARLKLLEDVGRFVGRVVVNNDNLEVGVVLFENQREVLL